jgi:hypothetical protein
MALKDALERLQKRVDAGEISQQEYEETKECLKRTDVVVSPLAKLNGFLARRQNAQVVRGTVRTVGSQNGWLTLDVGGRCVHVRASKDQPRISSGDAVIMLVNIGDSVAQAYHNETTGSNDLELLRTRYRRAGFSAGGFTAVALAIFATVFIGASHETLALPISVLIHTPLYLLSILGACVLVLVALLYLAVSGVFLQIHKTMRAIIAGDSDHALEQARQWLPEPKPPS